MVRRSSCAGSHRHIGAMVCKARPVSNDLPVTYTWRGAITDDEMVELVESHGGNPASGWWDRVRQHSLGWVAARSDEQLVGFVNVAWDGSDHAFLLDTKTRTDWQRRGIATNVVALAARRARAAGCEWLHVDFHPGHGRFYFDACGFQPTDAGLIHLPSLDERGMPSGPRPRHAEQGDR